MSLAAALPFGFRPALTPASTAWPWAAILILSTVLAIGLGYWWWQRRTLVTAPPTPIVLDRWESLARSLGEPDWYERLGAVLLRELPPTSKPRPLHEALKLTAERDASGNWQRLYRHWEWATFAAYPGTAEQQAGDLATAKRGWP